MRVAGILALGLIVAAGVAEAQGVDRLREASRLDRQTRAVEARSVTQPDAAARDARDLAQDVRRGGGPLSPDALRARRTLDDLAQPAAELPRALPALPGLPPADLPRSFDAPTAVPASGRLEMVDLLIDRARQAAADGRPAQALSDLAFAERQLDGLAAAGSGDAAERRQRIAATRSGLDGR